MSSFTQYVSARSVWYSCRCRCSASHFLVRVLLIGDAAAAMCRFPEFDRSPRTTPHPHRLPVAPHCVTSVHHALVPLPSSIDDDDRSPVMIDCGLRQPQSTPARAHRSGRASAKLPATSCVALVLIEQRNVQTRPHTARGQRGFGPIACDQSATPRSTVASRSTSSKWKIRERQHAGWSHHGGSFGHEPVESRRSREHTERQREANGTVEVHVNGRIDAIAHSSMWYSSGRGADSTNVRHTVTRAPTTRLLRSHGIYVRVVQGDTDRAPLTVARCSTDWIARAYAHSLLSLSV
jgi:hypothetical protein